MGNMMKFDYYYGIEEEQFSFYRVPRLLIKDERFKELSSDAKLLYGLIEKKRQGLGKPDIIYVKNFATLEVGREPESRPKSPSNTDVSTEVRKPNYKWKIKPFTDENLSKALSSILFICFKLGLSAKSYEIISFVFISKMGER